MSIPRHHAEWLSLVEASGPFLSLQVLLEAFPQGLEAHDAEIFRYLKQAYEEWLQDNSDTEIHRAWIEWVLGQVLEYPDEVLLKGQSIPKGLQVRIPEQMEILRPDFVLISPSQSENLALTLSHTSEEGNQPQSLPKTDNSKVKLLVSIVPSDQGLEKPLKNARWKASPATRMMELLHGCNVRLGLLTNGEQWMLVNAPKGETTGYISWYSNLWTEEKLTLRAFRSLLGIRRFFGVEEGETLEQLLEKSKNSQQEVTDQLGEQVRKAVEVLVQKLDKIDQDYHGNLLVGISNEELYQSVLYVMMRLVFLFSAEEKGLLLLGDRIYDQYYAVSTLRAELREKADNYGEEVLERRFDAWCRLLATFRAVYYGIEHGELFLPAYGGELFNPEKFPFLEGRMFNINPSLSPLYPPLKKGETDNNPKNQGNKALKYLPVDNRTVLHLLEALQILQVKVPGGGSEPRRLSFRALDVEQIGHVYEGLLDHTATRATETFLGLMGTKDKQPEVLLSDLEKYGQEGEDILLNFLKKETGRSISALKKLIPLHPHVSSSQGSEGKTPSPVGEGWGEGLSPYEESRYIVACNNDIELWRRIKPFYQLIRLDTFGYPVIIPQGSVFVTQGTNRRETGTHYTPKSLTEEIVKYTLEPLVYEGVAEGKKREEWQLKSVNELLNLKICDMAMGSGAFLVQVCRYLGDRILEAWEALEKAHPKTIFTVYGNKSKPELEEALIPDEDDRLLMAKRLVAERCVYGVDKNPLAVEMAKLSLWLETLQKNKPFTFLDHALKCGDSLVGVNIEQLKAWNLNPEEGEVTPIIGVDLMQRELQEAIGLRLQIEAKTVNSVQDQLEKAELLFQANARIKDLKDSADLLIGSYLSEGKKADQEGLRKQLLMVAKTQKDITEAERQKLPDLLQLHPFHWELEFPEVFIPSPQLSPKGSNPSPQPSPQGEGVNDENKPNSSVGAQGLRPSPLNRQKFSKTSPLASQERDLGGSHGFDALVGNPPFMGGQKITGALGTVYRDYCVEYLANKVKGSADLCAYFFLRGQKIVKIKGHCGLVATNTIAQGDTREVGLDQIVAHQTPIYRAIPSRKWEGTAALEVAYVWMRKGNWQGEYTLNDAPVNGITPYLTSSSAITGKPYRLVANQNKSFQGSIVLGLGFTMSPEESQALIDKDPKNKDVLFPYLNGQDLNSNPDQSPSRWVINFFDWPLNEEYDLQQKKPKGKPYAEDYPDCLSIVEKLVKPERDKLNKNNSTQKRRSEMWWQYGSSASTLYETIKECDHVLVIAATSRTLAFSFEPTNIVYSHAVIVLAFDKYDAFAILQGIFHECWAREYASSMKGDLRYTPSDVLETFPFPNLEKEANTVKNKPVSSLNHEELGQNADNHQTGVTQSLTYPTLSQIGEQYYTLRQQIMTKNQEGLTKTYNRFHNPDENDPDILKLRQLHTEMDYAVALAYGWEDLSLNHDFHDTKQGLRYTISEEARREILDRLLALNHQRYQEEVKQGLHDKGKKKSSKTTKKKVKESNPNIQQTSLF